MINNLDTIKNILSFESEDDFYHLQVLKRKKEHPNLGSNSYVVKTYYISNIGYLDNKMDEIIALCMLHNARAYINLNKRSFERIAFHTLRKVTEQIMNKDFRSVRKSYESVCGTYSSEENKKWIIDIDDHNFYEKEVIDFIKDIRPEGDKFIAKIPTRNGYHLIVKPFDLSVFKMEYPQLDCHRDNPTLLFVK